MVCLRGWNCQECKEVQSSPPTQPMQPWSWPTRPWSRLHMDFAGPLDGRMFLVLVDAHSKWLDVIPMKTATARTTIQRLRTVDPSLWLLSSKSFANRMVFAISSFRHIIKLPTVRPNKELEPCRLSQSAHLQAE